MTQPPDTPTATGRPPRARQLVAVDDDRSLEVCLNDALQDTGWEVTYFDDVDPALEYLTTHAVDALIVDVRMPKMDGDMVLDQLADAGRLEGVTILVCSSLRPPPVIWRRFEPHGAIFLSKDHTGDRDVLLGLLPA